MVIYENKFKSYISDNLDTPKALAYIWEIVKDDNILQDEKKYLILKFDKVFGLKLGEEDILEIPEKVIKLLTKRNIARANKDFDLSDSLRKQIESMGFTVKDTDNGTEVDLI